MEENEKKKRISWKPVILIGGLIIFYIGIFVFTSKNMQESMHHERASNMTLLMEKMNQSIGMSVESKWVNVQHFASIFVRQQDASIADAREHLRKMKNDWPEDITDLFLIDSEGNCYTSKGENFQWRNMNLLATGEQEFFVTSGKITFDGKIGPFMLFVDPLENAVTIDGMKMGHLGVAWKLNFLDSYFNTDRYGENSIAFLTTIDGEIIYRQEKASYELSKTDNLSDALKDAIYHYDASYEQLKQDIQSGVNGCISLQYKGVDYYIAYQKLNTKDWVSILMIPTEHMGSGTNEFMRTIILSTLLLVLAAVVILVLIALIGILKINESKADYTRQLIKAAEAERNANQAKTQFLSAMSHDIRTPMNAIIGMTTLASKHLDDPKYIKECLSKVTLASNHLLTLINDVLDISKVESGKMSLNPVVFSLAESINNLANIVRQQIRAKNQEFEIRVHNISQEYLFADELRLNQIFINILSNAVKYTPEGGKITVDLKEEFIEGAHDKIRLVYVVEDNGIGMTKEFQEKMYKSFARAQEDYLNCIQGTGLGLAISKEMVNMMNGTIECESAVGVGTKFTVKVEVTIAERVVEELMLPPMKILLVDDDLIFLETASDTLTSMGITPDCVSTGEEAIEAVEEKHRQGHDYPVVIIDWKLPGMDGIETTRTIRERVGDDVPIIVISAYERAEIEEAALAAGANGFISKPFFRSNIYRDMSEILGLNLEKPDNEQTDFRSLEHLKLLVAEDNDLNWEIAKELLAMHGIQTVRAENGQQCVDLINAAKDGEYDMILMDIQMPVLNGYEATKMIRGASREYVRTIPIVAMTADAFADDVQKCLDIGMNAHVAKPINISSMLNVIGNYSKNS